MEKISKKYKNILITGGAGFIGGNLVNHLLRESSANILNIDKLSYASDLDKFIQINSNFHFKKRYNFVKLDLRDYKALNEQLSSFKPDLIFHLAAESHVDNSICKPNDFIESNIIGTFNLIEGVKKYLNKYSKNKKNFKFVHVSTDEVFGSLKENNFFNERSSYKPNSPYSASKAASDHIIRAWHNTYGIPAIITNCSNNFGPWQFPEKLIPLAISRATKLEPIEIYGNGENIRDWIYVLDHISGLIAVANKGEEGDTYCIGAKNTFSNNQIINFICEILDSKIPNNKPHSNLIKYVPDRLGHDFRYAIDPRHIKEKIGWESSFNFEESLRKTILWYLSNQSWSRKLMK